LKGQTAFAKNARFRAIFLNFVQTLKMTDKQQIEYDRIRKELIRAGHYHQLDEDTLQMAASLAVEVSELQAIIDAKGYTYEFTNRDGGTMTKHRPEHQMLVESRSKYLVVLKELGMTPASRKRIEVELEPDVDIIEQLRAELD